MEIQGCLGLVGSVEVAWVVACFMAVESSFHFRSMSSCGLAGEGLCCGGGRLLWRLLLKTVVCSASRVLGYLGFCGMGGLAPLLTAKVAWTNSWLELRAVEVLVVTLRTVPFQACGQRKWSSWTLWPVGLVCV